MAAGFWDRVVTEGHRVPDDRPLDDLTAELVTMLGSPDPHLRDQVGYATLATWIERGVYDELLTGLGDGMAAGLENGLGDRGNDTVFRRSFSALLLAECVARDNDAAAAPRQPDPALGRPDRRVVRPRARPPRLRPRQGLGARGRPRRRRDRRARPVGGVRRPRADRAARRARRPAAAARPTSSSWPASPTGWRPQRSQVLHRNLVPLSVLEPWVGRLANAGTGVGGRTTRSRPATTCRRSCGRCTCSWSWARTGPTYAPTCCWSWSTPCEPPTRDYLTGE